MADLVALKAEFITNPAAMPYLAMTAENAVANADVINNASGLNGRTINNGTVDTADIRGQTTYDAFDGLTTSEEAWFSWLTVNGVIPVTPDTLQRLAGIPVPTGSMWGVGERTLMNSRMTALMQRTGSRAEEIADTIGTSFVSPAEVRDAALLP